MSNQCDHLLGLVGWQGEEELRVSLVPQELAMQRARDQRWMDTAMQAGLRKPTADAIARVRARLDGDYVATLHSSMCHGPFTYCPDCGTKLPPLQELVP